MNCIYFKRTLTFTTQEHIIPAALGGIAKLPLGYVSDEANAKFSPVELAVIRKSLLTVNRENVGPGKRGSMNVKKVKSPEVRILQNFFNGDDHYKIGFVFAGQTYMIPQFIMDFDDVAGTYTPLFFATQLDEGGKELLLLFKEQLECFLQNRKRNFTLLDMPLKTDKHFIIIGAYNNKWYAATSHKTVNMDWLAYFILNDMRKTNLEDIAIQRLQRLQQYYQWKFDVDTDAYFFLYLKTAFNACAYFIGAEQILRDCFDAVRAAILNNANCGDFCKPCKKVSYLVSAIDDLPDKSHYVIIDSNEQGVWGYVGFYSECLSTAMQLTHIPVDEHFTKLLVCDWKNRREYTISLAEEHPR